MIVEAGITLMWPTPCTELRLPKSDVVFHMISNAELSQLSLHEKLMMMERLWDELSRSEADVPVPQWHKDLLDEREEKINSGEAKFIDWEDAKKQIDDVCR